MRRHGRRRAVAALLALLAVPGSVWAAAGLRADAVRVGSRPGLVRVVVEFRGSGTLQLGEVHLQRAPRLYRAGRARVVVRTPGARGDLGPVTRRGVRVRVRRRDGALRVSLGTAARRFKALQERVLHDPERLVLDLWRASPPTRAATVRNDGCLALDTVSVAPGRVRASGRALRRLFENNLVVEVRGPGGRVVGGRPVTAVRGRWNRTVPYRVDHAVRGTVEAAVYSAKDGSLECLVQVAARLRPAP